MNKEDIRWLEEKGFEKLSETSWALRFESLTLEVRFIDGRWFEATIVSPEHLLEGKAQMDIAKEAVAETLKESVELEKTLHAHNKLLSNIV